MVWFGFFLFAAVGIAMILAREPLARGQSLVAGGRMPPGCVVAEGLAFLILAVLVLIFREMIS